MLCYAVPFAQNAGTSPTNQTQNKKEGEETTEEEGLNEGAFLPPATLFKPPSLPFILHLLTPVCLRVFQLGIIFRVTGTAWLKQRHCPLIAFHYSTR